MIDAIDESTMAPDQFLKDSSSNVTTEVNPTFLIWKNHEQALFTFLNSTFSTYVLAFIVGQKSSRGVWKVLVEEEEETTVREVVKDKEVEAISLLALVVTMLVQMEASITVCLSLISLANQNLQGFKVKLNGHNVKFVERMDMWLWIDTT
nr:hypothetical protein CFP56_18428 [Quercus suber]